MLFTHFFRLFRFFLFHGGTEVRAAAWLLVWNNIRLRYSYMLRPWLGHQGPPLSVQIPEWRTTRLLTRFNITLTYDDDNDDDNIMICLYINRTSKKQTRTAGVRSRGADSDKDTRIRDERIKHAPPPGRCIRRRSAAAGDRSRGSV